MEIASTVAEQRRRVCLTLVWFCSALSLAIVAPGISDIISVVGSLSAFFILVFPGIILLKLNLEKSFLLSALGVFLIVLGAWIFGLTFCLALLDIVK